MSSLKISNKDLPLFDRLILPNQEVEEAFTDAEVKPKGIILEMDDENIDLLIECIEEEAAATENLRLQDKLVRVAEKLSDQVGL